MKRTIYILSVLAGLFAATSCVNEQLEPCPEGRGIEVALRVEKFRARPPYAPQEFEEHFGTRVRSLHYLLYNDGRLIEQGNVGGVGDVEKGYFLFRREGLPEGNYRLAFVANASKDMMTGKTDAPEKYYIAYQGLENDEDHFRADLPFTVTDEPAQPLGAVLTRVHGVTRFSFGNVPAEVAAIEVSVDNVGERMPVCGEPDLTCCVSRQIPLPRMSSRTAGPYRIGTFCTLPGARSAWRLTMYGPDGRTPLYDRVVTDTLRIECNQLIDLNVNFKDGTIGGDVEFTVDVNPDWDGTNGTDGEIS